MATNSNGNYDLSGVSATNLVNEYPTLPAQPLQPESQRVEPRQIGSGNTRGDQIIKGRLLLQGDDGVLRFGVGNNVRSS